MKNWSFDMLYPARGGGIIYHDFDEPMPQPVAEVIPEPEIIAPGPTPEDVEAIRAQAFADGCQHGKDEAEAAQAMTVAVAVEAIAARLKDAGEQAALAAEAAADAMMKLLVEILACGYPSLREVYGPEEIRRLTCQILPGLLRQAKVVVHVNPATADAVAAKLAPVLDEHSEIFSIKPTASIAPGDTRITWTDGAAVRDCSQTWRQIADILRPIGLAPTTAPDSLSVPQAVTAG